MRSKENTGLREFAIVPTSNRKAIMKAVVENEAATGRPDLSKRVFLKVVYVERERSRISDER